MQRHTAEEIQSMFEIPELYDDPMGSLSVFMGEEWPEIPEDNRSQARLIEDANRARERHHQTQRKDVDTTPADAWSEPTYVEPDHSKPATSTRELRTDMARHMQDDTPCAFCRSLFPLEVLENCESCMQPHCYDCIGDGRLCKDCRPLTGWFE